MNDLPVDIKRLVYEYADDEELAKLCMLNKNFSEKVCNSNFWINRISSRFGIPIEEIREFKGKNTLWAYYKHLSELATEYNPLLVRDFEKIYNHHIFTRQYKNMFKYYRIPKWLNKEIFEEEMLYKLIDLLYNFETDIKMGDLITNDFVIKNVIDPPDYELMIFIQDLADKNNYFKILK